MTAFHFKPLVNQDQIRVLHLFPGIGGDFLSGHLQHVQLGQLPYEALSYEWGGEERSHSIQLQDGRALQITKSLYDALADIRQVPPEGRHRLVWADSICINQDDIQERSQQVALMGSIYRKASRVITYIGPERDGSLGAIQFAGALHHHAARRDSPLREEDLADAGLPPLSDPQWPALRSLLLRPWASRCWCALEFLLNRKLVMMCGRTEVDWSLLPSIAELVFGRILPVYLLPGPLEDRHALAECLSHLNQMRHLVAEHRTKFDLYSLLSAFHPFRATDPRDKIYSLLGLAVDRDELDLPFDYSLDVEDLYVMAAGRILTYDPTADIFAHCLGTKTLRLPSWVPDWSCWNYGTLGVAYSGIYSASGETAPELTVHMSDKRLDIAGCLVDEITALGSPILPHYRGYHDSDAAKRHEWLAEQHELVATLELYPTGADLTDVLWRTLIGNLTFFKEAAKDDYRECFEAHVRADQEDVSEDERDKARQFIDAVRRKSRTRRLATTARGYLAAVPEESAVGDRVCMFDGYRHLFVVREHQERFVFLGSSYVHGLMDGEILQAEWYRREIISLV